jgi:hypothetical protein
MTLPPAKEPFPVRVPFKTAVDLYKLGTTVFGETETTVFAFDDTFETTISQKLDVFESYPDHSMIYLDDDTRGLEAVYWQLFTAVADEYPNYASSDEVGFTSRLLGVTLRRDHTLEFDKGHAAFPALGERSYTLMMQYTGIRRVGLMLSLSIQADQAIMRHTESEPNTDVAESLFVALPTHWNPAEKLGQSLSTIHQPIGDGERLVRSSPRLIDAMINKGPFFRYNWSLANLPALCQNHVLIDGHALKRNHLSEAPDPQSLLEMLYFRVERQTFLHYPTLKRGVFFIQIYQRPLITALKSPEHVQTLHDAVTSMTEPQLEYRAMEVMRDKLLAGLDAIAQKSV